MKNSLESLLWEVIINHDTPELKTAIIFRDSTQLLPMMKKQRVSFSIEVPNGSKVDGLIEKCKVERTVERIKYMLHSKLFLLGSLSKNLSLTRIELIISYNYARSGKVAPDLITEILNKLNPKQDFKSISKHRVYAQKSHLNGVFAFIEKSHHFHDSKGRVRVTISISVSKEQENPQFGSINLRLLHQNDPFPEEGSSLQEVFRKFWTQSCSDLGLSVRDGTMQDNEVAFSKQIGLIRYEQLTISRKSFGDITCVLEINRSKDRVEFPVGKLEEILDDAFGHLVAQLKKKKVALPGKKQREGLQCTNLYLNAVGSAIYDVMSKSDPFTFKKFKSLLEEQQSCTTQQPTERGEDYFVRKVKSRMKQVLLTDTTNHQTYV